MALSPSLSSLAEVAHAGERHLPTLDPESINHYRHLTAYHFARSLCRGVDVLDYACGTGYGANLLARRAPARSLTAMDIDPAAIQFCRVTYRDLGPRFVLVAPGGIPMRTKAIDVVLLFQAIEHVDDDMALLQELKRVLRPGGVLALTTPNVTWSGGDPDHPANPFHVREYTAKTLFEKCAAVFSLVKQRYLHASFRAGGSGIGIERSRTFRIARRLRALGRPQDDYCPPVSLADFAVTRRQPDTCLDLLYLCTP